MGTREPDSTGHVLENHSGVTRFVDPLAHSHKTRCKRTLQVILLLKVPTFTGNLQHAFLDIISFLTLMASHVYALVQLLSY